MKVYKDVISGAELFSDAYPAEVKEDGLCYEVKSEYRISSLDIDENLIGGNKSAEDPNEDGADHTTVSGINIVMDNNLSESNMTKEVFKDWLKTYCKKLKAYLEEKNPSRVAPFMSSMQAFAAKVLKNFKEYQFYVGDTDNPDAMVILCYYSPDDQTNPRFLFFKDGLEEVKYALEDDMLCTIEYRKR